MAELPWFCDLDLPLTTFAICFNAPAGTVSASETKISRWEHTALSGNADDIDNSEKLFGKLYKNTKNRVDQPSFLKVRLFDMIVNDWDRHEDQSKYIAFGRDRDQSFSRTDGVSLWLISTG